MSIRALGERLAGLVRDPYAVRSYAQEGEDLVLRRIFEHRPSGFYVDVGAHHPRRFSNTYLFYLAGWRGINVEPNPDLAPLFGRERPRDITLELGVSDVPGVLTYYRFNDAALNTFDPELARERDGLRDYRIVGTAEVRVERLDDILARHLPAGTRIDFLSVDVEGHDVQVLRSNDWERFRPEVVLAEALGASLGGATSSPVHEVMARQGYELFGKTVHTLFFRDAATERV
ncbi:MAG TPA: FkbM family methyltransferase [Gemmatimonadaceae bacterium]|nr:FkbM family methyltransferase [Gemmatimonadaceae bacterium]